MKDTTEKQMTPAEHHLQNLLAVIHGDGGHYAAEHGLEKATEDAIARWYTISSSPTLKKYEDALRDIKTECHSTMQANQPENFRFDIGTILTIANEALAPATEENCIECDAIGESACSEHSGKAKGATTTGAIVCTGQCSEIEIAVARAQNRMWVNEDGIGFILRVSQIENHGPEWTRELPNEQGLWWWWNEDGLPVPVSIMYSGTDGSFFASAGQWGWNRHQSVKDMGGLWTRLHEPETPSLPLPPLPGDAK